MPEITRFYGIKISMYAFPKEHNPPHIHVLYEDTEGAICVRDSRILDGNLSRRTISLVNEWISIHRDELIAMWEAQKFSKLPPLR